MKPKTLAQADGDANPMPCSAPLLGVIIPKAHQKDRLDQGYFVGFVLRVIQVLQVFQ
jgi:hypothetical protein